MNKKKLLSVLALHGDTIGTLAEYLGMARSTISLKLNEHGSEFNQGDIAKIKRKYNLTPEEIDTIFFS